MLFALICTDKPGHLPLRLENRPAHLAFLDGLNVSGKLKFAGPFLGADGKPDGSLVMIDVVDRKEAESVAAADPYARAGLFATVDVRPWNWVVNAPGDR